MDEDNQGQIEEVVETPAEENPQVEMPATDKPADEGLPADASERTRKEFEKLKEHNRILAEENKALRGSEPQPTSVFDSLRPTPVAPQMYGNLSTQQVADISQGLIDQEGYVDQNALYKALKDANDRATRAEVAAQQSRDAIRQFEEREQVKTTYSKFPQLDPSSESYDPRFFELTRNEMVGQMMRGEQDFLKAAEKVSLMLAGKPQANKPDQKAKLEQINAEPSPRKPQTYDESLVQRVRMGEKGALAELLNQTGN
jgi:hypothetical protein